MDGNGRWAENKGLSRGEGHRQGVNIVKLVVECCLQKNIPILSLWAFGSDNWRRPIEEIDFLMQLFLQSLQTEVSALDKQEICLRFTGDRSQLSSELQEQMQVAEQLTQHHKRLTINLVINYGGKWDILQATKALAQQVALGALELDSINEETFAEKLNMSFLPDPDLFIRTSGEQRISNFFLWQLAYTELYFSDLFWPDFSADEFTKALDFFASRERRYGKTSRQINHLDSLDDSSSLILEQSDYA